MYKKIVGLILVITLSLGYISYVYADDEDENTEEVFLEKEIFQEVSTSIEKEPTLNSRAAIIYDRTTKKVIWGKNENTKRAMASTTKIMTAIVVLENVNLSDTVTISKKAANTGGSRLKINTDDKISVNDLLYGLMLRSGNDAAVALAEYVGGSVEGFAKMMNEKAKQLHLENTNFVTPHGLDDSNHYTTAYELAKLTDYALQNKKFCEIVNTKSTNICINGIQRNIYNTNELLGVLSGVNGVKTGFTGEAGRCLVTSCTRNGNQIITVVLGADTKKQRTSDSAKLIEYAFKNFERVNLEEIIQKEFQNWKQINCNRIYIDKAKITNNMYNMELELSEIENKIIPLKLGDKEKIKVVINAIFEYKAPVEEGRKIGTLIVMCDNEILETIDILNKYNIEKKDISSYMFEFFKYFTTINIDFLL